MMSILFRASGRCPHRASTATCFLVVLLGPLASPTDVRAAARGWQGERDAGQTRTSWRAPTMAPAASQLQERTFRTPRATAVMGIRG